MKQIRSISIPKPGQWLTCTLICVCLCATQRVEAQSDAEFDALNNYVEFLNESIHGLFTAHALMVISNKEVNKYIDLDSYSLNKLSNSELQSNLFDKSDKENYTTFQSYSPLQLLKISKEQSSVLSPGLAASLNEKADRIGSILNRMNRLRYDIFDFIETNDLEDKESIYKVYEMLEECASLFESFAAQQRDMLKIIDDVAEKNTNSLYRKAKQLHDLNKTILYYLRYENGNGVNSGIKRFNEAFDAFHNDLQTYNNYNKAEYQSYIQNRKDSIYQHLVRFQSSSFVPRAYEIYGNYYYYHNQIAKRFVNWSGPGYVRYLNKLLENMGIKFIRFSEQPLIFKVVYPMKLDELNHLQKTESFVARSKKLIENKLASSEPLSRENSPVAESTPQEDTYLKLELTDFNMIDKDTISVLLNGEYILKNYGLTDTPKELKILLSGQDRFIIEVIAENDGLIAPNTPQLAYRFDGQRKKHRLQKKLLKGSGFKITLEKP